MPARTSKPARIDYLELMQAASQYVADARPICSEPREVAALLAPLAVGQEQEFFWVLLLDSKNRVLRVHTATIGLVDRTQIHPREVFREAIRESATRILLAHNHPSGDPTPSTQDIAVTRQIVEAGKIIGIDVLDHVVIGAPGGIVQKGYASFRQENLM